MLDFEAIARDFHIPIAREGHHHCKAGWVQTHCPMCSRGDGWHMGWSLDRGVFHCWRCGTLRSADVLLALTKLSMGVLRQRYPKGAIVQRAVPVARPRALTRPDDLGELDGHQQNYLFDRGFDPFEIEDVWGIKGCGPGAGAWRNRIIIPIHDAAGTRWVSWTARTTSETVRPKYKTLDHDKSLEDVTGMLYGHHLVPADTVVVVEGPMDAWAIGPGAVAILGAGWTGTQSTELLKYRYIHILFDGDKAGRTQAASLSGWLSAYAGSEVMVWDGFESDPAELAPADIKTFKQEVGL